MYGYSHPFRFLCDVLQTKFCLWCFMRCLQDTEQDLEATITGYDKVLIAVDLIRFCMGPYFLLVRTVVVILSCSSFFNVIFCHPKAKVVREEAMTAYYHKCWEVQFILRGWRCLNNLLQVYLVFIISRIYSDAIRTQYFWLCFVSRQSVIAWNISDI